jgi:hypothetical protein
MENTPVIRGVYKGLRPSARCKSRTAKPAKKRTAGTHRNGFLTHSFKPFYSVACNNFNSAELEFFNSLKNLCAFQGWAVPDVSGYAFPENISKAMEALKAFEKAGLSILLLQDAEHEACLATAKTFDTNFRLYYIPVRPLYNFQGNPQEKPLYNLTAIVFAYLYQVCGVPYFTEPGYMDNEYDTLQNWIDEEDDNDDEEFRSRQKMDLTLKQSAGEQLLTIIQQPYCLTKFAECINRFEVANGDPLGEAFKEAAGELYKLAADYPDRRIKDSMHYEFNGDADNDQIYWENYISFYWSGNDSLNESIYDMVNSELQEMGYQEEPMAFQWFNTPQTEVRYDFDFEARLFALFNRLTELLNDYDYEEFNA